MKTCLLPAVAAAVLGAGAANAAGCDTPIDAALKLNDTPYHMTMTTQVGDGSPERGELISTEDATYVNIRGTWHPGPKEDLTLGDVDVLTEGDEVTCSPVRSEVVNNVLTVVWQIEDRSDPDEIKHQTVWIGKDDGRILRMQMDIGEEGQGDRSHMVADVDYTNVLPPR